MAYLGCDVCDECMLGMDAELWSKKYTCCLRCEHAYERVKRLKKQATDADFRADELFEHIDRIMVYASQQIHEGQSTVSIPADVIKKTLEIRNRKDGAPDYWEGNYYMLFTISAALDLFTESKKHSTTRTLVQKLQQLRDFAGYWLKSEYPDSERMELTVEQLIDKIKKLP
jgi:hypothetical protein